MKKSLLRETAVSNQKSETLNNTPTRDHSALIVPIGTIQVVNKNIRSELTNLTDLVESIRELGILQPLILNKKFELIAGFRRLEAAKQAGLTELPVRVGDLDGNRAAVVALVENIQREAMNPTDEINCIKHLLPIYDGNQTRLAEVLGKSKTYVSQCIKAAEFLKSHDVSTSKLSKSALFELASSANPKELLKQLQGNTVKEVREKKERKSSGPIPGGKSVDRVIKYSERRGGRCFNLRVNFDFDKTGSGDRERLLRQLHSIIKKIENL
jgi:ParB family chromosome partitioning protein